MEGIGGMLLLDVIPLDATFPTSDGPEGLRAAVDRLTAEAVAAVEGGTGTLILDTEDAGRDRAPIPSLLACGAVHQALSNTAVFAGALLGGFLATHAPRELQVGGYTFVFASGLWLALCASSLARAVVIAGFLRGLRETRLVRPISPTALAIRVIRANVLAEWLFELLPGRRRPPKDHPPPPEKPL